MANKSGLLKTAFAFAFLFVIRVDCVQAQAKSGMPNNIIEIRAYNLKPGMRDQFHQLMAEKCVPLLQQWEIDVVAFGPSIHDENSYFLMRAFKNLDDHRKKEDAFYSSKEWEQGPQDAIMAIIKSYTTIVVPADAAMIKDIKANVGKD